MPNSASMSYDNCDGVPVELKKAASDCVVLAVRGRAHIEYPPKHPSPPAAESSSRAPGGSGVQKKAAGFNPPPECGGA